MLLQRKVDRAMKWSRERRMRQDGRDPEQEALDAEVASHGKGKGKDLPSMEELRAEELKLLQEQPIENKDVAALVISGLVTVVPICLAAIGGICLLCWLFFFR